MTRKNMTSIKNQIENRQRTKVKYLFSCISISLLRGILCIMILTFSNQMAQVGNNEKLYLVSVPNSSSILLDGKILPGEWVDAIKPPGGIYLKRDSKYLYLAVGTSEFGPVSVDLYFDLDKTGHILNLHASAKLGECEGVIDSLPEWHWWNNCNWSANVGRVKSFLPQPTFLSDEAKEFQISLEKLSGHAVSLSITVQDEKRSLMLPLKGHERYNRRWLNLEL
ncbi:MAG: hypothetical protein M1391_19860 [Bacteroidetes bacterium]|nr:hypothetical protein [Bacteroidota bacterium]